MGVKIVEIERGDERRDLGSLPAAAHAPQGPDGLAAAVAAARGRQHAAKRRGA